MKFLFLTCLVFLINGCSSRPNYSTGTSAPYFSWPVKKGTLTQKFKKNVGRHQGIDISSSKNTQILAAESGKVIYAGEDFSGYGNLVIIEHRGDTWASFYAHLNGFRVREGQYVAKGQAIGLMGRTGRATGVHLHFEIRYNLKPVNPLEFLSKDTVISQR
jgi:murein DD-endopeptidase MepM/ murein hydrolase activator NlpD